MIYPSSLEQKLGFDLIRNYLTENCLSDLGRAHVQNLKFQTDHATISTLNQQVEEFVYILNNVNSFPQNNYLSVQAAIDKLKIDGYFLNEEELLQLLLFSRTILGIVKFFDSTDPEEYPQLKQLFSEFHFDKKVLGKIGLVIDERGIMRPDASPRLQQIRKEITEQGVRLRSKINRILAGLKDKGYIGEDFLPTIRNGRMVVPIQSEYKRQIQGIIHDESLTGQTTYIEPASIFDDNNILRELYIDEQREIRLILVELSHLLASQIPSFVAGQTLLGQLDFIRSKAKLARKLHAVNPHIEKTTKIQIEKGRNPILLLKSEKNETVVPLSAILKEEQRILIISGPNAGGKSVCLKTIGLLQYMLQCGLLVPVNDSSSFGIFEQLFVDIGDDQSVENDLSTYSSHLTKMKHFLFYGNKKTLFLIDEFGTGTDPEYGGIIAETILEELEKTKAYGVITTHYDNLKHCADKNPSLVNGAMLFDLETLTPKYQLSIGKPGSSFALEIATKIGLEKTLIERAKSKLGTEKVSYDKALKELEQDRIQLQNKLDNIKAREAELKSTLSDYKELKQHLEANKKELLYQAKREAKAIYKNAEKDIEKILSKVKVSAETKQEVLKERDELKKQSSALIVPQKPESPQEKTNLKPITFQAGQWVKIEGQDNAGKIVKIKGNKAEIEIGAFKLTIPIKKLSPSSKPKGKTNLESSNSYTSTMMAKKVEMQTSIDVRGMRVHDALAEVDLFLDNAIMAGLSEIKILHGKGNGILKDTIRQHLKGFPQIRSAVDEHVDLGGSGITVIVLH